MDTLSIFQAAQKQRKHPMILATINRAYWHSVGVTVAGESSIPALLAEKAKNTKNRNRRMRDQVRRDCGLVKVRGALGGVYWE